MENLPDAKDRLAARALAERFSGQAAARQAGLAELIETRCADFGVLGEPLSSIDLI